jgi:hypothetical protein
MENNKIDTSFKAMDIPNLPCPMRARLIDYYDVKKPETFFAMFIGDE